MKTTHVSLALWLCLTTLSPSGDAQPAAGRAPPKAAATKASDADVDAELTGEARQLFKDGIKALDGKDPKRWPKAYAKFLAAYRIKPHYQIASNLGATERELGKYRDAAEHLSLYLRDPRTQEKGKEEARRHAQELLDDVLKNVGSMALLALPDGAEVKVDGSSVGRAPLPGALFVEPGSHVIEARHDGYEIWTHPVRVDAGEAIEVKGLMVAIPPPQPTPPPTTTATATVPTAPTTTAPPPPPRMPPGPNRAVVIAGVVVTGVGAVTGVVLVALAQAKGADGDASLSPLTASGATNPCQKSASVCSTIHDDRVAHDTLARGAVGAWAGAGAVGIATLGYALLAPKLSTSTGAKVVPTVGSNGAGVAIVGAW